MNTYTGIKLWVKVPWPAQRPRANRVFLDLIDTTRNGFLHHIFKKAAQHLFVAEFFTQSDA